MRTDNNKFPLYTVIVLDDEAGIPVVWSMQSAETGRDIATWLKPMQERVRSLKEDWTPSCFTLDDCNAEMNAVRDIFGPEVRIYLCTWHVQRNWLRHLLSKVKDSAKHKSLMKELRGIMFFVSYFFSSVMLTGSLQRDLQVSGSTEQHSLSICQAAHPSERQCSQVGEAHLRYIYPCSSFRRLLRLALSFILLIRWRSQLHMPRAQVDGDFWPNDNPYCNDLGVAVFEDDAAGCPVLLQGPHPVLHRLEPCCYVPTSLSRLRAPRHWIVSLMLIQPHHRV